MNTSKQVNVIVGLLMVFGVATLLYFLWDSTRAEDAETRQLEANAERGGKLYALNCRACHGLTGRGVLEAGMLPGAPLNVEGNRPVDPDTGLPDEAGIRPIQDRFRDTIKCGRVGTLMPPWSQDQGGALNEFQIEQLVTLISGAMSVADFDAPEDPNAISEKGWEHAIEEANEADFLDKQLAEPVSDSDTVLALTDASGLKAEDMLRIDDDPLDEVYEVVEVVEVREAENEIEVERGAFGTRPAEHQAGTEVFAGPILPGTTITGEQGTTPPCGQLGVAAPAAGGEPIPIEGEVTMEMGDNFFQLDGQSPPTLGVSVGQEATIRLVNNGQAVHNMHIAGVDDTYDVGVCQVRGDEPCSDPDTMTPGDEGTITFRFDQPGTFVFRCDFHPIQMTGQITVTE